MCPTQRYCRRHENDDHASNQIGRSSTIFSSQISPDSSRQRKNQKGEYCGSQISHLLRRRMQAERSQQWNRKRSDLRTKRNRLTDEIAKRAIDEEVRTLTNKGASGSARFLLQKPHLGRTADCHEAISSLGLASANPPAATTARRFLTTFHSLIFLVFCTKYSECDDLCPSIRSRGKLADP